MLLGFLFLTFVVLIYGEYRRKSLSIVLWAGLLVFFFLPHAVDALGGRGEFPEEVYSKASVFALWFNVVFILVRLILAHPIRKIMKLDSNRGLFDRRTKNGNPVEINGMPGSAIQEQANLFVRLLFYALLVSFFCLCLFIVLTVRNVFSATWVDMFNNRSGALYSLFSNLFSFSLPVVFLAFLFRRKLVFIISLLITVLVILVFRVRIYAIAITVPFFVYFIFNSRFRITPKNLALALVLAVGVIYIVLGIQVFRIYGTLLNLLEKATFAEFNKLVFGVIFSKYSEFSLRNAFYMFIEKNNDFSNFGQGLGYIRLLFLFLPTSLSGGLKPQDFAMDMAMAYDPVNSIPGVNSMHPTLYGDCYANLGWPGIGLAVFWVFYVVLSDLATRNYKNGKHSLVKSSMLVAFSYSFTLIARGAVYYGVLYAAVIFVSHSLLWGLVRGGLLKIFVAAPSRSDMLVKHDWKGGQEPEA